ncbi:MAG: D-Ala-D-Ala carboxypeptidase family metallohydrolase [Haloferula sp.]
MPTDKKDYSSPIIKRRSALGTLGMGALATLAGTSPASAFFIKKKTPVNLSGLPRHWVALQGHNLPAYADFLAGLKLKYVTPRQVIDAHAKRRGSVWNMLPPKHMWKNMAPTLKAVDKVGAQLGRPVKEVVSAYRSPAYNRRCAGASRGSWHQANVAVDVKFPVSSWTVSKTSRSLRSRGLFRGGVGHYSGFTHIDTRGHNVDW